MTAIYLFFGGDFCVGEIVYCHVGAWVLGGDVVKKEFGLGLFCGGGVA